MRRRLQPHHFCIAAVVGVVMVFLSNALTNAFQVNRTYIVNGPAILPPGQKPKIHTYSVWLDLFGQTYVLKTSEDEKQIETVCNMTREGITIVLAVLGALMGVLCLYAIRWLWPLRADDPVQA
jgi:hypothetical protein